MSDHQGPPPNSTHTITAHPDVVASRRATAIAEVQKMQSDLMLAHDEVATLKREAERLQDRIELILDERNKYRAEAHVFRVKLIELATQMSNINLMTVKANEITMTVNTLIAEEQTREQDEQEQKTASEVVEGINRIAGAPEVLSPRDPPQGGGLSPPRVDHDEGQSS